MYSMELFIAAYELIKLSKKWITMNYDGPKRKIFGFAL